MRRRLRSDRPARTERPTSHRRAVGFRSADPARHNSRLSRGSNITGSQSRAQANWWVVGTAHATIANQRRETPDGRDQPSRRPEDGTVHNLSPTAYVHAMPSSSIFWPFAGSAGLEDLLQLHLMESWSAKPNRMHGPLLLRDYAQSNRTARVDRLAQGTSGAPLAASAPVAAAIA